MSKELQKLLIKIVFSAEVYVAFNMKTPPTAGEIELMADIKSALKIIEANLYLL